MHVKGQKLTAGEKENIVNLYRQGKTQDVIVSITGVSKGRVNKTIKLRGISRPQGNSRVGVKVRPLRPVTVKKSPDRHKLDRPLSPKNLTVTRDYEPSERIVRGQSQPDVKSQITSGQKKSRSRSNSFGIGWKYIGYAFLGLCLWLGALWVIDLLTGSQRIKALLSMVFPNLDFETQENPDPEVKKTFGFGGRSVEDLDSSEDLPFEDLPENPF